MIWFETFLIPAVTFIRSDLHNWSFFINGEKYSERDVTSFWVFDSILPWIWVRDEEIRVMDWGPNFGARDFSLCWRISF